MLFFPEEMKNSWLNPVMGKFPESWQDSKQDYIMILFGFPLKSDKIF